MIVVCKSQYIREPKLQKDQKKKRHGNRTCTIDSICEENGVTTTLVESNYSDLFVGMDVVGMERQAVEAFSKG